jgi:hypothetical protein
MVFIKDGIILQNDDDIYNVKQSDEFTLTLSMSKITNKQNGIFECRVQNEAGVATYSDSLKVNGKYCSLFN